MRSKVAVAVSLIVVLAIGAAALAINTRILDAASHDDIGRANEIVLPAVTVNPAPTSANSGDHDGQDHSPNEAPQRTGTAHVPDD